MTRSFFWVQFSCAGAAYIQSPLRPDTASGLCWGPPLAGSRRRGAPRGRAFGTLNISGPSAGKLNSFSCSK
ncbi:MAG: hypothetical protein ACXWRZ_13590 [Bdellovibrio sp.]